MEIRKVFMGSMSKSNDEAIKEQKNTIPIEINGELFANNEAYKYEMFRRELINIMRD